VLRKKIRLTPEIFADVQIMEITLINRESKMSTGRFDYVLQASASGFTSEVQKAERSVDGLDKSQKNAKRSGDDWSKGTEKLTTAFKALGVGLAVASAAGAVIFNKMIAATIEQDRVMAQLNATLKSTGGAAGKTASDLAKTAAELQKITTYGDEAIISAQSLLLTFKEIKGDNFDRTTKAVLDMSTAMGTDLKSAAIQLGKALNDPATQLSALSRSGVPFRNRRRKWLRRWSSLETSQKRRHSSLKSLNHSSADLLRQLETR